MNAKVLGILVLLLVVFAFMSYAVPDSFLKANNIENVARRTAMYGILGIGVAFVIITSGIDLSIGSVVCLSAILLTMFLHVDYSPPDEQNIIVVRKETREVFVPPGKSRFAVGDRIRYYKSIRAKDLVATIQEVEEGARVTLKNGDTVNATRLVLDRPPSRDDDRGRVARVYEVEAFKPGEEGESAVTVRGEFVELGDRDKIQFINAETGKLAKEVDVDVFESTDGGANVSLKTKIDDSYKSDWLAMPIKRQQFMSIPAAIGSVMLIALVLGCVHGLLITKLDLPPFLVTLCGLLIYRGVSRWLVRDQAQGFGNEYESSLNPIATGTLELFPGFQIPYAVFILIAVAIAAAVFLNRTIWGRYMLALGNSEEAARYSGINTHAVTIMAYVICTGLAALGGMLFALQSNSVSPGSFGNWYELYAIAAAVLGGCSLRGGEGSIVGVIIGTTLMQTLNNTIVLLKISNELEFAIIGCMILAGVVADVLVKRLVLLRRAQRERRVSVYQRVLLVTTAVNVGLLILLSFLGGGETGGYLFGLLLILGGLVHAAIVFLLVYDCLGWVAGGAAGVAALIPGLNIVVALGALVLAQQTLKKLSSAGPAPAAEGA